MSFDRRHSWDVSYIEAREIQLQLRAEVVAYDRLGLVRFVAGIDVGFEENGTVARAAVAVLTFPGLELCEHAVARRPTSFPYIPGLLSFRETPIILDALESLTQMPDLLICDGHGRAHPRRFGLACHIGVLTSIPSMGVAKSRLLVGTHEAVDRARGSWKPVVDDNEIVGAALRTRTGVRPVYVSIGHRLSLETAIDYVMKCAPRYRAPEPMRWAHRLASGDSYY